jgi:hypothetical protein
MALRLQKQPWIRQDKNRSKCRKNDALRAMGLWHQPPIVAVGSIVTDI